MIKTNEWTVADLIKYLVAVQTTLTAEELSRLKITAFFAKEGSSTEKDEKPKRYQARELYEPLSVFRDLGLPLIDWGTQHKWRPSSDEGLYLSSS